MVTEIFDLLSVGGWPGRALVLVSVALWTVVFARARALRPSAASWLPGPAEARSGADPIGRRLDQRLAGGRDVLRALVVIAPLLGLLGTVGGMVELFDSLHGGAARIGQGSVAGGISTALVTTQLGLIIGVPGLVAARLLEQREARLRSELTDRLARLGPDSGELSEVEA